MTDNRHFLADFIGRQNQPGSGKKRIGGCADVASG